MKNKPLTFVLLGVVALLYYNIFFKVKGYLQDKNELSVVEPNRPNVSSVQLIKDTIILKLDYRDPFGQSNMMVINNDLDSLNKIKESIKYKQPEYVNWPDIKYHGLLKRTSSSKPLGILSVDGYKHQIRKQENLYDGLVILSMNAEAVKVRYKKETKTFFR